MLHLCGAPDTALTRKKPSKTGSSKDAFVRRQSLHTLAVYLRGSDTRSRGPSSTSSLPPSHAGSPPPWCMSTAFSMPAKEELKTTTTSQTESLQTPPAAGTDDSMPVPAPSPGMWSRLGQNLNMAGVGLFLQILGGDQRLAVPHLTLPDIQTVDWAALRAAGFKAVVFDKDNTLTRPFAMQVEPQLVASLDRCKGVFGSAGIALYSNSAGLRQYDPEGHEAASLEAALGVAVMRHTQKKPAGDAGEVADHFGCATHELIMVGDRYLTDVVFGNRHGMLTIRPAPLTTAGEPLGVLAARRVEEFFVGRWTSMGVAAPPHALVPAGGSSAFITSNAAIKSSQQE